MSGFRFDCAFCDVSFEADTGTAVKREAKSHLADSHVDELEDVFAVAFGGNECENGCGFVYPDAVEDVVGYECPTCGHDNFPPFLERYVYWRIEKRE